MKKSLESLKNLVTLKTLAALLLVVSVVFFFLPVFTTTGKVGISFLKQSFSACSYMIGNPAPAEPAWEHLWVALALILPIIAVILLFGEQSTGKTIVISLLLVGTIVTWVMMIVNINKDFQTIVSQATEKDLASIVSQTIVKETDACYLTYPELGSNIFGQFGTSAPTLDAVLAKVGLTTSDKLVSIAPLFIVNLVLVAVSTVISALGIFGAVDLNKSFCK